MKGRTKLTANIPKLAAFASFRVDLLFGFLLLLKQRPVLILIALSPRFDNIP